LEIFVPLPPTMGFRKFGIGGEKMEGKGMKDESIK
jgi:hypothetical protein